MSYRLFHLRKIITYPECSQIQTFLTAAWISLTEKCGALQMLLYPRVLPTVALLVFLHLRCLGPALFFWRSVPLRLCLRPAPPRVWVGAMVRRMGPGVLPAVLMAPDCFCAGRTQQAPAGRGAVKRISPALTYPCMVYHPVAKYSYCIWRSRATTKRRWSFGREPWRYSAYFERF